MLLRAASRDAEANSPLYRSTEAASRVLALIDLPTYLHNDQGQQSTSYRPLGDTVGCQCIAGISRLL